MSYLRIPSSNVSRNENELRATVDGLRAAIERLKVIEEKMAQIGGGDKIAIEYNLASVAEGDDLKSLVTSASGELSDALSVPFTTQLLQRVA